MNTPGSGTMALRGIAAAILAALTVSMGGLAFADGRDVYSLKQGWDFFRPASDMREAAVPPDGDRAWQQVSLPHSVRLEPLNASGGRNYQGPCWYQKRFTADDGWKNRNVYLHFEGAMQVAEVSLNGKKLTTHFGGYQPFTVDLTGQMDLGKANTLLVKLDNSDNAEVPPGKPQAQLDFTYFGGLYREVWVEVLDRLHITDEILADKAAGGGVFVRTPEVAASQAVVEVQTDLANERDSAVQCRVKQELVDDAGRVIAAAVEDAELDKAACRTCRQTMVVENPKLWHPCHPDLYTLRTTILEGEKIVDNRTTRMGIRRIEFKPEGLFINGEKFFASGFNRHQDHPYVGYALPKSQQYRDAKKMRDAGMTSFRSHYPQDPAFMDACDELGILCIVSNPGWQFFGNHTWVDRLNRNAREMVRRDRNHPCAVLWEPFPNETNYSEKCARSLNDIVHEEYPGDQCFTAGSGETGKGQKYVDVVWERDEANKYQDKPVWAREWGDSVDNWDDQQGRVRVARGWGEIPLITQAVNHAMKLDAMLKNAGGGPESTRFSGVCVWAGIDCYRGYHHQPFYGGALDLFRLPKFDYYFFQSQRDPTLKVKNVDSGPMVFIANCATAYSPSAVTVFSNCEAIRFSENGKVLATQQPDAGYVLAHPPFTFQTKTGKVEQSTLNMTRDLAANSESGYIYETSEYKAEGLIGGRVAATHTVKAPGVMSRIDLEADGAGREFTADGNDWMRVYAKVCDKRGTVHPFADDLVAFSVEGEGAIVGNAAIGANPVRAEAGIATVLIRSTATPGRIKVRATAFGLKPAEIEIESKPPVATELK